MQELHVSATKPENNKDVTDSAIQNEAETGRKAEHMRKKNTGAVQNPTSMTALHMSPFLISIVQPA